MPRFLSFLPLIALIALSAPVYAQDDAAAEEAPETAIEDQLAVGETPDDQPQLGQTYVREPIGDWELRCIRTENPEDDPCQLYQLLKEENGNPLAEISMFRLPEGNKLPAGATIIVPLETLLTGQLGIAVDNGQPKSYPFSFCNRQGCFARIGLTAEDIASYKRGVAAKVMIRPYAAPDQIVSSTMSLKGFTAGFDKASVLDQ
ncbi:MAG: invasion associated locus B family protein [Rhodobacteraceae bacterium]|nr:MAG: invasion associated locus B family protein [Paracoccaceae bacterium]